MVRARIRRLNFWRSRNGPSGNLVFLRDNGSGQYENVGTISESSDEWTCTYTKDPQTGRVFVRIEVIDRDGIEAMFYGASDSPPGNKIAIEKIVYQIEPDSIVRPFSREKGWTLGAYQTEGKYETP